MEVCNKEIKISSPKFVCFKFTHLISQVVDTALTVMAIFPEPNIKEKALNRN